MQNTGTEGGYQLSASLAEDTFYGQFPLIRLLGNSIFQDYETCGTYDLTDHADDVAVRDAARALCNSVLTRYYDRAQFDVVFASIPFSQDLNNEALYVFNKQPKIFVHNYDEVVRALTPEQLDQFQQGHIDSGIMRSLCEAFSVGDILVVLIKSLDISDGNYFYLAEARDYVSDSDQPKLSCFNYGFLVNVMSSFCQLYWLTYFCC